MASHKNHADHRYIVARQERYVESFRRGRVEDMMEWMDPEDFVFADIRTDSEGLNHKDVRKGFENTFANFHDLEISTLSLHGHRYFTAWEWQITAKPALNGDGGKLSKEESRTMEIRGCNLMWWNDKDKIVRNHEYVQVKGA